MGAETQTDKDYTEILRGVYTATQEETDRIIYQAESTINALQFDQLPASDLCNLIVQSLARTYPDAETRENQPETAQGIFEAFYGNEELISATIEELGRQIGDLAEELEKTVYKDAKVSDVFADDGALWKKILENIKKEERQQDKDKEKKEPDAAEESASRLIDEAIARGQARTIYRANNVATNDLLLPQMYTPEYIGGYEHPVYTKHKKTATTLVRFSMRNRKEVKTSRPVSEFDDAVSTAINSLIIDRLKAGYAGAAMTLDQICRQLKGDLDGGKVTEQERAAVQDTVRRLTDEKYLKVWIDATEELRARGVIGPEDVWKESGPPLVKISEGEGIINGRPVKRFVFAPSVLVLYSMKNGHASRLPIKALEIHDVDAAGNLLEAQLRFNNSRIQIVNYLQRKITVMLADEERARDKLRKYRSDCRKNEKLPPEERADMPPKTAADFRKVPRVILFSTMIADLGIKDKPERIKEYTQKVLTNWTVNKILSLKSFNIRKPARNKGAAVSDIEFWARK